MSEVESYCSYCQIYSNSLLMLKWLKWFDKTGKIEISSFQNLISIHRLMSSLKQIYIIIFNVEQVFITIKKIFDSCLYLPIICLLCLLGHLFFHITFKKKKKKKEFLHTINTIPIDQILSSNSSDISQKCLKFFFFFFPEVIQFNLFFFFFFFFFLHYCCF